MEFITRFFKLQENKTTIRTEIIAGITTFMTMAYILFLNPNILSATGMDKNAVFFATAVAVGLVANFPIALAPGMGLMPFLPPLLWLVSECPGGLHLAQFSYLVLSSFY